MAKAQKPLNSLKRGNRAEPDFPLGISNKTLQIRNKYTKAIFLYILLKNINHVIIGIEGGNNELFA
jgi:hypothetical protein